MLDTLWGRVQPGGILAGHDFTRAHEGVARAVCEFAVRHELTVYLTQVKC